MAPSKHFQIVLQMNYIYIYIAKSNIVYLCPYDSDLYNYILKNECGR